MTTSIRRLQDKNGVLPVELRASLNPLPLKISLRNPEFQTRQNIWCRKLLLFTRILVLLKVIVMHCWYISYPFACAIDNTGTASLVPLIQSGLLFIGFFTGVLQKRFGELLFALDKRVKLSCFLFIDIALPRPVLLMSAINSVVFVSWHLSKPSHNWDHFILYCDSSYSMAPISTLSSCTPLQWHSEKSQYGSLMCVRACPAHCKRFSHETLVYNFGIREVWVE